jgi:hypothetical protein
VLGARLKALEVGLLARFCVERPGATLADLRAASWAFERMGSDPDGALDAFRGLCA